MVRSTLSTGTSITGTTASIRDTFQPGGLYLGHLLRRADTAVLDEYYVSKGLDPENTEQKPG
jgi:hypothetical protein